MKYLLIILFTLITLDCKSQIGRFRSKDFATRSTNSYNQWNPWSDWIPCGDLIIINSDSKRITIYSKNLQTYDIINIKEKTLDKDGNPIYTFYCLDENMTRCELTLFYNENIGNYIIISFSNLELMYKVNFIKD